MPSHPLTEEEFNIVKDGVLKSAPPNMDEDTFNKWASGQMPAALNQAETLKGASLGASIKDGLQALLDHPVKAAATAAAYASPMLKTGMEELATNPNVPKMGSQLGRIIGGVGAPIGGAVESGPIGFLTGLALASKAAWAGGRTGWFTAKLAQQLAAPASKLLKATEGVGSAMGMMSAEGDVLSHFNSPEELAKLKKATGR